MTRKLKSSARRSRRNKRLFIIGLLVIVAITVATAFVFAQLTQSSNSGNANEVTKLDGPLKVKLQTSMGDIVIQLRDDKPITAGNFRNLVERGLYDGTIFNRVETYLIQAGNISQSVPAIPDELGGNNTNVRGTVAMAKSLPNTATSRFFINVIDNNEQSEEVDKTYTVFGYVIEGMDVVDAISRLPVDDPTGVSPRPLQDVTIIKAEILP
jgi:peptidylprolyl isomerase